MAMKQKVGANEAANSGF